MTNGQWRNDQPTVMVMTNINQQTVTPVAVTNAIQWRNDRRNDQANAATMWRISINGQYGVLCQPITM